MRLYYSGQLTFCNIFVKQNGDICIIFASTVSNTLFKTKQEGLSIKPQYGWGMVALTQSISLYKCSLAHKLGISSTGE
jgi:hypothetical protein